MNDESKETELKPCPFPCERPVMIQPQQGNNSKPWGWDIFHHCAKGHIRLGTYETEAEAITAWNTRFPDTAQLEAQTENQAGIISVMTDDFDFLERGHERVLKEKEELVTGLNLILVNHYSGVVNPALDAIKDLLDRLTEETQKEEAETTQPGLGPAPYDEFDYCPVTGGVCSHDPMDWCQDNGCAKQ